MRTHEKTDNRPLTWNDLAGFYDLAHIGSGRPARTLEMDTVFSWAERMTERFFVDEEGLIYLKKEEAKS